MAQADDASITIVWIWLSCARALAAKRLGTEALAEELLVHWMATGDLPWTCKWKPRDAEGLARWEERRRELEGWGQFSPAPSRPSPEFFNGDPRFWSADPKVDWENSSARETASWGAKAPGIKVSREHLLAKLAGEPREREEAPGAATPLAGTKDRLKPQQELCWRIFRRLFPDGNIPDEVELGTTKLREKITVELEREAKQTGKKQQPTPSWDVVRAARRNSKISR